MVVSSGWRNYWNPPCHMQSAKLCPILGRCWIAGTALRTNFRLGAHLRRGRILSPLQVPGQIMNKNGFDDALMATESL
jgi:hypothetical protein